MRHFIFCIFLSTLMYGFADAQEYDPRCDINKDGAVDSADLLLMQHSWHGVAPTPTPGLEEVTIELPGLPGDATPLVLVRIPAGSFLMGSTDEPGWSSCQSCEQPVHTVNIEYDFYLGKREVTQAQWEAIMGSNPSVFNSCGNDCPVETVSWGDCQAFVSALNALVPGGGFRMPSEAEWEYACRAGTTTRFYFGDSNCIPGFCDPCELDLYAWWCGNDDPFRTKVVGQKAPNPWGLYDMHGNIWEFCQDWWHFSYDTNYDGTVDAPIDGSAWEAGGGTDRVARSGQWDGGSGFCRSSARTSVDPGYASSAFGFRVARNVVVLSTPSPTPTSPPTDTPTVTPTPFEELTVDLPDLPGDATPLILVRIPAGSFEMGSNDDASWASCSTGYPCDRPVHTVNIENDFWLGKYEITQGQWQSVMGYNPSYWSSCGNDCPVETVSWSDCQRFVAALNVLVPGGGFRMPSEAEWEYACRAGTTTRFYLGDSTCDPTSCIPCELSAYAWWCGNNNPNGTKVAGQKPPNLFGLYDMHGNVEELCEDDWHDTYTGAPSNGDPWIDSPRGEFRVIRGGAWGMSAANCRSSHRYSVTEEFRYDPIGFRVARDPVEQSTPSPTPTPGPEEVTVDLPGLPVDATPLVLLRIPAGSYLMGSTDDTYWNPSPENEQPVHKVYIADIFYMGKYEITQAQWQAVMGNQPATGYGEGNNHPVYNVSWDDIRGTDGFLDRLNALGQGTFRLPSEAEWEYACRAGTTTRFYFGDSTCHPTNNIPCDLDSYAWWVDTFYSPYGTKEVGQLIANAFGLYDMHGNVREWCEDDDHWTYSGAWPIADPWVDSPRGVYRVIRGGGHNSSARDCRSASRGGDGPTIKGFDVGFRVVRDP